MEVLAVIPARYASTRFPGKPLARDTGKFLIEHVYERVARVPSIARALIATDDPRIAQAAASFDAEVVMTRDDHPSGTDRIAEVLTHVAGPDEQIVLNVQGDEPEIEPASLEQLVQRMQREPELQAGTLAAPYPVDAAYDDPALVKVICDRSGRAIYFSRAAIASANVDRGSAARSDASSACPALLHVGVYAYRRGFLRTYAAWEPTPLERAERLEQLRILEHGVDLAVERIERTAAGIDTPEEYAAFVARYGSAVSAGKSETCGNGLS